MRRLSMAEYAVSITFAFENESAQTILLDTVDDTRINTSSTISRHPVPTGEYVADHMYKEPASMTISGVFSLNGGQGFVITREGAKLASTQLLFERIKNEGTLCEIFKIKMTDNNTPIFLKRSNMVLTNIAWTEQINSLKFSFTFSQVLTVDVKEYDVDTDDSFLPNVTDPKTLSFIDTLIDWTEMDKQIVDIMRDEGLINEEFFTYFLSNCTTNALVGLGVSLLFAKIASAIGLASIVPGIGTIIGVVAAAAIIASAISGLINSANKKQFRTAVFQRYEDDKENAKEVQRFSNFIGEIHQSFEQLNSSISVYQVAANEEQECMLSLDGNYYIFDFEKNNTSGAFALKVFDIHETEVASMNDVSGAAMSIFDCNTQNKLFRVEESGSYVYLINTSEETNDLTTYCIVLMRINPDKFSETIKNLIINALYY